jgi:excisionase family DNA binding protein
MSTFSFDTGAIAHKAKGRLLLTITEAAEVLGCSTRHIDRLIDEADANRKSRWRWGRELINLARADAQRRMVRINVQAVVPSISPP